MKLPAGTLRFKPEFDSFLFAPVGAEESGMSLSVLSMLARLDLDPWQEAAQLAALSRESATLKMVSLLGALPNRSLKDPDGLTIATRLVAMLPRPIPTPAYARGQSGCLSGCLFHFHGGQPVLLDTPLARPCRLPAGAHVKFLPFAGTTGDRGEVNEFAPTDFADSLFH